MTLDGGSMFDAGAPPYKLRPMAAEVYGTKEREFSLGTLRPHGYIVTVALWSENGQAQRGGPCQEDRSS